MDQVNFEEKRLEEQAQRYFDRYRDHMDALSESVLAKARGGSIGIQDAYALGKQLENYEFYAKVCEEEGNTNQLGILPKVAFDVITAVQGVSILPIVASVQPVDEEHGTVYFKNVRQVTGGATTVDPLSGVTTPNGYASNNVDAEEVATIATGTSVYNVTLAQKPFRSQTLVLVVEDNAGVTAKDIGGGAIYGVGMDGVVVDYEAGTVTINVADPTSLNGKKIFATYQTNYELADDLPQIDTFFDSKTIQARIYALKGTIGMFQSFGMRKRFGMVAEDEIAKDLVAEINREIGGDMIRKLYAAQQGNTQWDKTPPGTTISYFEHKQTFKDSLADAESILTGNAGRGTISQIIAGREVCAIISTLPGFVKLTDGNTLGAHVYGTLDGITIIRVLENALLDSKKAICLWKGTSPFEAPVVYSPFMPLTVTTTLPNAPNPLGSMKAAAVWAGVDVLVNNFITGFEVIES